MQSESIKNLAAALVKFQSIVPAIGRDAANPFFKSKYASLGNIISKITPALTECGLAVTCMPTGENSLRCTLMHVSGEYYSEEYFMPPVLSYKTDRNGNQIGDGYVTPQAIGSKITYQRRYALVSILNLNVDEDDDGNEASRPVSPLRENKPTISGKRYSDMVKAIEDGKFTKDDAKNRFALTSKQVTEIDAL